MFGACKKYNEPSVQSFIAQNCAQHPINFYLAEQASETRIYRFGPQDKEFRSFLAKLKKAYEANGEDISGQQKVTVVSQYLPNYIESCQAFFQPLIQDCQELDFNSPGFEACIKPYNRAYQQTMARISQEAGPEPINLEALSLNRPTIPTSEQSRR
jgi:hypothetical protein